MKRKTKKVAKANAIKVVPIPTRIYWHQALGELKDRVFKIRTPDGHGTGFHLGNFGDKNSFCAVATALHVVREVLDWDLPMKLIHAATEKEVKLKKENDVYIFPYPESDLAIVVFKRPSDLMVPTKQLEFIAPNTHLKDATEIGWCGFPGLRSDKLCFFHGFISCYIDNKEGYLVDGVAINGVSGGPVFYIKDGKPLVAGVITAYMPNRTNRDTLPGLSIVIPVSPYEEDIKFLKNLSEVRKEAAKQKKAKSLEADKAA